MELQDRKKAAFAEFRRQMQAIEFKLGKLRTTKDQATISFPDNAHVLIHVATIKGGFAKGEFGSYMDLCIYDGPIYRIMKETRLDGGSTFPGDMIVRGTSHSLVPGESGVHAFRASVDVEAVVTRMINDVLRFFVPIVEQFTGKYEEAVDFILSHDGAYVRKPFCMCVILLGLADAFDRLGKVIAHAEKSEGFWDFHRSKNYESIVQRIQKWFKKNKKRGDGE